MLEQDPPNAIQIEPTEGCNLYCDFCGLRGIRERAGGPYFNMPEPTATAIAQQIKAAGWTARIEFAMHGEPTMHPDLPGLIRTFRTCLPTNSLMLTSNGGGLVHDPATQVAALFAAGLNTLALDDYQDVKYLTQLRATLPAWAQQQGIPWYEYPRDSKGHPHRRMLPHARRITVLADIREAGHGTHATLSNHAGAAAPLNDRMAGKRCARPFRELAIRWDGGVALCCNDWRGIYRIGNVNAIGLRALWQSPAFVAARKKLYHGLRDFGPCRGCDDRSYRVGLLPDRMGKQSLPKPDAQDDVEICAAGASEALVPNVVWRAWERHE